MKKNNNSSKTVLSVWGLAQKFADELGLKIWDVKYVKEGSSWYLKIFIDKEGGVSINDCEAMSKLIDKPLDNINIIDGSYNLEVSSPGINRELTRDEHFLRYKGQKVIVRLIRPHKEIAREFKAIILDFCDKYFKFELLDGRQIQIEKNMISFIKLDDFGGELGE